MSRYARRVDRNHSEIVSALRKCGAHVHSTANVGNGFPDLFVGWCGRVFLLEVKDGKAKLTDKEIAFHAEWCGYPVHVVRSVEEALTVVGITKTEAA